MSNTRTDPACARCDREEVRFATTWPEGRICRRCYQRATRIHGTCPKCGVNRLLPGLLASGEPACVDCTGIPKDFHCSRCGREDEPVRRGLCAHCCLNDDLTVLLAGPDGEVSPAVQPLFVALTTQRNARSATIWLTKNHETRELLRAFATGAIEMTHAAFDTHPAPERVAFLRTLLVEHGILEKTDIEVQKFDAWVTTEVSSLPAGDKQIILQYARWVHVRRIRDLLSAGKFKPGSVLYSRQSITAAIDFLAYVGSRHTLRRDLEQIDIDEWLSEGPTTRSLARPFVRWCIQHNHLPPVNFPYRVAKSVPILTQQERLEHLRRVASDEAISTYLRVAGALLLLFAQPITRIAAMTLDQVEVGEVIVLRITQDEVIVPPPFDRLIREHIVALPNLNTSAHRDNKWLFPGGSPGKHLSSNHLMTGLRNDGIDLRAAKNAVLRRLVLELPAPVVADSLGYSYNVAERHRLDAGAMHLGYVSLMVADEPDAGADG